MGEFEGMPEVPQELWQKAKDLFKVYLFMEPRKQNQRTCICSSCGVKSTLYAYPSNGDLSIHDSLFFAKHDDRVKCPSCGKDAIVKAAGLGRKNLYEYHAVVFFLPISFDEVWIRSFYLNKEYCSYDYEKKKYHLYDCPAVEVGEKDRYRLRKGDAVQWRNTFIYRNDWHMLVRFLDPFAEDSDLYHWREAYTSFYAAPIEETFLKYSAYETFRLRGWGYYEKYRYLAWYAKHPSIEMMVKAKFVGGARLVYELIYGSPNASIVNWNATSGKDIWKISKEELNTWIAYGGDLDLLKAVKKFGKMTPENVNYHRLMLKFRPRISYKEKMRMLRKCRENGVCIGKLLLYLLKVKEENPGCSKCPAPDIFITWDDYTDNAAFLKYDLKDPVVFMPKNLFEAHDRAFRLADAIRVEKETKAMQALTVKLEKKYGYHDDNYTIMVPKSMQDIIREGQEMHHCVGGYAKRHADGSTVILFLRANAALGVPLVTIEMNGNTLRQAQAKKNTAPSPEVKQFIEKWLVWLQEPKKESEKKEKKRKAKERQVAVA